MNTNTPKNIYEIPKQYEGLANLVSTLAHVAVASENENLSEEGKERLANLFDVVAGGLATYIDREFHHTQTDSKNVLKLLGPIFVNTEKENLEEVVTSPHQSDTFEHSKPNNPENFDPDIS